MDDFRHFVVNLSKLGHSQARNAIALLWYEDRFHDSISETFEMTAHELAQRLKQAGLTRGQVNVSRLARGIRDTREARGGSIPTSFGLSLTDRSLLNDEFLSLLRTPPGLISDGLLPQSVVNSCSRSYIHDIVRQINGAYDHGFYDACAVLCRRIIESLLVECFEHTGKIAVIQESDGNLKMLDAVIGKAKSAHHIRLPRGTPSLIDKIKEVGDTAAHDRYHITTKQDIDEFRTGFRKVVSQLLTIAGMTISP